LVVVGTGVVRREALKHALEALDNVDANTLGLVLNRIPRTGNGGYSYYGYESTPEPPAQTPRRPTGPQEPRASAPRTDRQPVPSASRPRSGSARR
jgi:Mrp family chromosome partitioning ATPase